MLQSLALSVLPLDALEAEAAETAAASAALGERPPLAPADALALLLLEWFKRFFTWVCACCCAAAQLVCDKAGACQGHTFLAWNTRSKGAWLAPGAPVVVLGAQRLMSLMHMRGVDVRRHCLCVFKRLACNTRR